MWTPCEATQEVYNEETNEIELQHVCPYEDYGGSDRCRVCCGLGVDE